MCRMRPEPALLTKRPLQVNWPCQTLGVRVHLLLTHTHTTCSPLHHVGMQVTQPCNMLHKGHFCSTTACRGSRAPQTLVLCAALPCPWINSHA